MTKVDKRKKPKAETSPKRSRLLPDEREKQIVAEAIRFFAEVGFDGQTRELAKRLNITQPLLYRYFPTKQGLVDRVYKEIYLNRWNPEWQDWIEDRSTPVAARLKRFYTEYYPTIVNHDWMRIFFQAGMRNVGFNQRYLKLVRERILLVLCAEVRHELDLPSVATVPVSPAELELYWGLHGSIVYDGIRQYIYGTTVPPEPVAVTNAKIDIFMAGIKIEVAKLVGKGQK
ncbi:TetR/AcrR family transcriptional regulator [Ferrovibrio sp.]|uniref:TetR/AcrR family transcriptional regulator n=1 Tax=Ferrovibrio sp. TaxID=1917215 RepID=UPI000CC528A2|nr:TetR/AcrR family transcriptional regulator [Ferrovibrio sp.]PJI40914.1 MAG: TetR family transcriptional regulator [Ferrovibrio sp.]